MTDTIIRPLAESEPRRKRWTRQECAKLVEFGILRERYELIDGEIIEKMGQNPPHVSVLRLVAAWLIQRFGYAHVRTQSPIVIRGAMGATNEPEPDVAVTLQPDTAYQSRHPEVEDLLLLVEVSDTTLAFDLATKARLYASAGVQDYWVMDTNGRRLHVHRTPTLDGYQSVSVHDETETVSLLLRPEASIRISDLLPVLENEDE